MTRDIQPDDEFDERYLVPSLMRGITVLQCFSREHRKLGLSEIAAMMGVTRSSAFRIVYTLKHLSLLTYDSQTRTYALGSRILSLGYGYLSGLEIVPVAMPHLDRLRDVTGWSAHLGERDGTEVVYLARAATHRPISSNIQVGSRLPAHATSMGRVLLSALEDREIMALYADVPLERFGEGTIADVLELCRQVKVDAVHGNVVQVSGYQAEVAAIAAPIFDFNGRIVAAVNVSVILGSKQGRTIEPALRDAVVETAAAISSDLGYRQERPHTPSAVDNRSQKSRLSDMDDGGLPHDCDDCLRSHGESGRGP